MKKKICLVVGHWQIENLTSEMLRSWRDVSYLKTSTGASGERDWHWNELMPRLRDKLNANGNFYVYIASGIYDANVYNQDFDLWIALHYDGGGTGERCMISAPNRTTQPAYLNEGAFSEAERFCAVWKSIYPGMVGVPNNDNFVSAGMKDYYAFDYPWMDTPAVIVEHFNHTSPRGQQLKNDPELVAEADYQAVLKFFNLDQPSYPANQYQLVYNGQVIATYDFNPQDKITDLDNKLRAANETILELQGHVTTLQTNLTQQEKDNVDLLNQLQISRKTVADLGAELSKAHSSIATLEEQVKILETKLNQADCLQKYTKWQLWRYIITGKV